jgi:hypothetical protein
MAEIFPLQPLTVKKKKVIEPQACALTPMLEILTRVRCSSDVMSFSSNRHTRQEPLGDLGDPLSTLPFPFLQLNNVSLFIDLQTAQSLITLWRIDIFRGIRGYRNIPVPRRLRRPHPSFLASCHL